MTLSADDVVRLLELEPHPEGGHFRETFRDPETREGRSCGTAIYYLLKAGERSRWHRVDAVETWHWYGGGPLALMTAGDGDGVRTITLGNDLGAGQRPQHVVSSGHWQSAHSLGDWTLIGCTVAPGFEFAGFEMAPEGWSPEDGGRS